MNSALADSAGEGPRTTAAPTAAKGLTATLLTLVRREFWEHRSLWLAPLVVTALLALVAVVGRIRLDVDDAADVNSAGQRVAIFTII